MAFTRWYRTVLASDCRWRLLHRYKKIQKAIKETGGVVTIVEPNPT